MRRILLEFALIVAGVLSALAVDEFRDVRKDRTLEHGYLVRLSQDLRSDSAALPSSSAAEAKEAQLRGLLRAESDLGSGRATLDSIAAVVAESSRMSWGFPPSQRVTFDELQSTGSLGLIRDEELRRAIAQYYRDYKWQIALVDARITGFPEAMYQVVPRTPASDFDAGPMSEPDFRRLREVVSTPEFSGIVTAELNRHWRQAAGYSRLQRNASQLLLRICGYLGDCPAASA